MRTQRPVMMMSVLALAGVTLISAGCNKTEEGAGWGAAIGAAAGAVIGHQSGHGLEGAAIGAGAGAIVGGAVGNAQDKEDERYRRDPNYDY